MPGYSKFNLPPEYRAMTTLDASGFAWEWLRRNPTFRALWTNAGPPILGAAARAATAARRVTSTVTEIGRHPLAERLAPWGLTFAPPPDTPAIERPLIGWSPAVRTDTLSLVRPLPWARAISEMRFTPDQWGPGVFRIAAHGGTHLLIRRHGAPELALWLPARLTPIAGEPFGLYLHADRGYSARLYAAGRLRRALGVGAPLRTGRCPDAERMATMLCVYDLMNAGASMRDIADQILSPFPDNWRASSERSDLRRLADTGSMMVDHGYRSLLNPLSKQRPSATL